MGKIVSIRCRRHKKRFNVPVIWLKTSKWLCPHCYEMLSQSDRAKYAPKGSEEPEIREADPLKHTMYPDGLSKVCLKKQNEKAINKKENGIGSLIGDFLDKKNKVTSKSEYDTTLSISEIDSNIRRLLSEPKEVRRRIEKECIETKGFESEFEKLKPKHKIHCVKCGQDYPCFSFWFNISKYLCPECASDMTLEQIDVFNKVNSGVIKPTDIKPLEIDEDESETVMTGYGCSDYFINRATPKELLDAVKKGRLSKARARIELRRRKNSDYFNDLPEQDEVQFGSFR